MVFIESSTNTWEVLEYDLSHISVERAELGLHELVKLGSQEVVVLMAASGGLSQALYGGVQSLKVSQ